MTKNKKPVGRPRKSSSESKKPGISLRLSQDELELIERAVSKTGTSKSDWARICLLKAANEVICNT